MERFVLLLSILEAFLLVISANPVPNAQQALGYMIQYGYINEPDPLSGRLRTKEELVSGIKLLQRYGGLKETGEFDNATLKLMAKDRCGVTDFSKSDSARRKRRYTLQGSKWRRKDLTYKIVGYSNKLSKQQQRETFKKAFKMWQDASQLTFRETNSKNADIMIDFQRGYHRDGYPFDGRGGTLAHAFYPHSNTGISGDAHFDSEEPWTVKGGRGVDLEWVAIHEFGHSLGLGHSRVRGSIMYPWYQGYKSNIKLTDDDLRGIRKIYGSRGAPRTPQPTQPPRTDPPKPPVTRPRPTRNPFIPDACTSSFDTFFMEASRKKTYAFKGQYYFVIGYNAGLESGPHKISSKWRELRTPVNAAFTDKIERTFFFVGSQFYVYFNNRLLTGPRHIRDIGLPDELINMDAVLRWGGNGQVYFFKGDQYWRLKHNGIIPLNSRKPFSSIEARYPRKINGPWKNVPINLDGAMQWRNGKTFFFKNKQYYRLDDFRIQVEPNYPKLIGLGWMRCTPNEIKLASENEKKRSAGHAIFPNIVTMVVTLLAFIRL